ncbi:MAG: glycosyl hydrolase 53 family protein [Candidatus Delongbacteria bacterium]
MNGFLRLLACGWLVSRAVAVQWGADLSSLPRLQAAGAVWTRDGAAVDPLDAMADQGWGLLRLRLWHTPQEPWQGLDSTLALARRGRAAGLDLLLDFHYSDTWADPGHQEPPAAWQGLALPALRDSVRGYTRRVLERFAAADCAPGWVQLGNEIDGGLLWPVGRVDGAWDTPTQWSALRGLLQAASQGVDEAFPGAAAPPGRLLHLANSGWEAGCRRWLDSMSTTDGPDFEGIALSYYPWWHGPPEQLQLTLNSLAQRYGRDLFIVETAYPFTLGWDDDTHNLVGMENQLVPGFPATPAGQRAFLAMLRERLAAVPDGLGHALLGWEPAWIAAPGAGSAVENLAWFDFGGQALPALGLPAQLDPGVPRLEIRPLGSARLRLDWEPVPGVDHFLLEAAAAPQGPWSPTDSLGCCGWESPPLEGTGFLRLRSLAPTP